MAEANPPHPFTKDEGYSCSCLSDEVGSEDMCEHGMNLRTAMGVAERPLGVIINIGN